MEGEVIVMKMKYTKPSMAVEVFTLSQMIATNCNITEEMWPIYGKPNHQEKGSCGWLDPTGELLWTSEANGCGDGGSDGYEPVDVKIGMLCYNNYDGGYTIFSSQ